MASTFTLKSNAFEGRYMQLTCTQRKDNTKSYIDWVLSSVGGEVNYYSTGPTAIYINGTNVYYKDRVSYSAEVFPAAKGSVSGTIEVAHNTDGSKTIAVGMQTVIYYGASSSKTYSGNWELDPIPRGATFTSVPAYFGNGELPTINYTNPLGDSVSKVEICIADSAGQEERASYRDLSKTGTTYKFTAEDMKAINGYVAKNSTELKVMFVIHTRTADGKDYYDGESSTYLMVETADTLPSVSLSLSPINPESTPSSLAGEYIQGKTSVSGTITATPKYNATISKYAYRADKKQVWSTSNKFTTDTITSSGNVEVVAIATDSREFTGETSQTKYFHPYSKPLIEPIAGESSIQCYRCEDRKDNSNYGKRKGNSTSVWIKVKRSYHSLGGRNLCKLQWRHRLSTEAWNNTHEWKNLIARTDTVTDEYDALVSGVFLPNESYVIQIRAVDDFVEYSYEDFEIPTQDVALHLGAGGTQVTVGDYCDGEDYTFRSAWKAKFDKGIYGTLTHQPATNVLSYALGCQIGTTPIYTSASSGQLPPNGEFKDASGFVFKITDTQITVVLFSNSTGSLAINIRNDTLGGWLGWKYIHTSLT